MTTRDRNLLAVVAAIAMLAAFWFLALKPRRTEATAAAAQITTQQQRLQTAQHTVAAGLQAKSGHLVDEAALAELGKALPADDDLASLLYTLDASARDARVHFDSVARSSGAGATATAPAAGGTGATTAGPTLPPGAVVGTAGIATLPFTFSFQGSYFDLEHLLDTVQGYVRSSKDGVNVRGRLLSVDGIALTPGDGGLSNIQAKVAVTAYLSPDADAGGAGAGAPGSTTSPPTGSTAPAATPSTTAITAASR